METVEKPDLGSRLGGAEANARGDPQEEHGHEGLGKLRKAALVKMLISPILGRSCGDILRYWNHGGYINGGCWQKMENSLGNDY